MLIRCVGQGQYRVGRGSGGCCIHNNISCMWLGRSDDVLTARAQAPSGPSRLGRGGHVVGRGSGGCCIHESITHIQLGRSGNALTARRGKVLPTDRPTDRPTR